MNILWGKPKITATVVSSTGASSQLTIPTPVADSTTLNTNAGDKHEALIEGGGAEAVRYDRSTFTLEFTVRFAAERKMPFSDVSHDGQVSGTYKFKVEDPDNAKSPTCEMAEANVRYEDEYNADDGARRHFFCESLVPADGGDQIKWTDGASVSPS